MGRKEKRKVKATEPEDLDGASTPPLLFSSDDDEANQDLSLKIVEKAIRMRTAKLASNDTVLNGAGGVAVSPSQPPELPPALNDDVFDRPSGIAASQVEEKKKKKKTKSNGGVALPSQQPEPASALSDDVLDRPSGTAGSQVKEKKKKTKSTVESVDQRVVIAEEPAKEDTTEATENQEAVEVEVEAEASMVQVGDNIVLRKLLRGPRYFDPPNSSWGACYNCGEEGHAAVNCTAEKRKKPCYVCGGLGHSAKQCTKGHDCYTCNKGGHRAKDCPEKHMRASKSLTICLRCGNSGHDMLSCKNDYSLDDLKEIRCYICKTFGHLCCVNTDNATRGEVSCYKCGQLGHTGLACTRWRGESTGASSCFRCGEEGHMARECTNIIKAEKRNYELSNAKPKRSHKVNDYMGHRSAPPDLGKTRNKRHHPTEERGFKTPKKSKSRGDWMTEYPEEERGFTTPKKSKSRHGWMTEHPAEERDFTTFNKSKNRGGWMTEHPGEFSPSMSNRSSWRNAGTASSRSSQFHPHGSGSHTPSSNYSSRAWQGHPGAWNPQGSDYAHHPGAWNPQGSDYANHRYSASRFGNSSSNGHWRSYDRW